MLISRQHKKNGLREKRLLNCHQEKAQGKNQGSTGYISVLSQGSDP